MMKNIFASLVTGSHQRHAPLFEQEYLLGLRGLLVLESFVWVFLQTFVPAAVKSADNASGPAYQVFLRKIFSVLFWNDNLLSSSIILLSARTICLPFLNNPSKTRIASAAFRRGLRLWLPTAVALAVVKLAFLPSGLEYIDKFKASSGNTSFVTPTSISSALVYFNSVFNLFWTTNNFTLQAGNTAFPSQTLWIVNVVYSQSYTIYMTMVIIPYTRNTWRIQAYICFIIAAWWVQSWAWYSITGLLLADAVTNMEFKAASKRGVRVWRSIRCPSIVFYLVLLAGGLVMQYLWTAWRPELESYELQGHTGLYYTSGLNTKYDVKQPQARDDNYLIILGFFLLLESSDFLQMIFRNSLFVYLGRRSLSWFLLQSTIIYTIGIKLFVHVTMDQGWSFSAATTVGLLACVSATALAAELFYRVVDYPSTVVPHLVFDWLRT